MTLISELDNIARMSGGAETADITINFKNGERYSMKINLRTIVIRPPAELGDYQIRLEGTPYREVSIPEVYKVTGIPRWTTSYMPGFEPPGTMIDTAEPDSSILGVSFEMAMFLLKENIDDEAVEDDSAPFTPNPFYKTMGPIYTSGA